MLSNTTIYECFYIKSYFQVSCFFCFFCFLLIKWSRKKLKNSWGFRRRKTQAELRTRLTVGGPTWIWDRLEADPGLLGYYLDPSPLTSIRHTPSWWPGAYIWFVLSVAIWFKKQQSNWTSECWAWSNSSADRLPLLFLHCNSSLSFHLARVEPYRWRR